MLAIDDGSRWSCGDVKAGAAYDEPRMEGEPTLPARMWTHFVNLCSAKVVPRQLGTFHATLFFDSTFRRTNIEPLNC